MAACYSFSNPPPTVSREFVLPANVGTCLADKAKQGDAWAQVHPGADPKANPHAAWGAGGAGNLALTALSGAAGGNVSGSLGSMAQVSAINVLQGLATCKVKEIADSFTTQKDAKNNPIPNATSEAPRPVAVPRR